MAELWSIAVVLVASIIGAFGALMFKKCSGNFSFSFSGIFRNQPLIAGVALYATATLIFVPALRGGELSVLYPLVSTSYIWATIFSLRFLGEKMNRYKALGVALIVLGVSLIGME